MTAGRSPKPTNRRRQKHRSRYGPDQDTPPVTNERPGLVAALAASTESEVVTGFEGSLLIVEPELARLLRVAGRPGSTLSAVLREAWDSDELRVLTRSAHNAQAHFVGQVIEWKP